MLHLHLTATNHEPLEGGQPSDRFVISCRGKAPDAHSPSPFPCCIQAIEENGGAVSVETGGAFCICLTGSGHAIVWGKLGHAPHSGASRTPAVAEIMGLPRVQHIAAGHSHALLSDGDRVWALGR